MEVVVLAQSRVSLVALEAQSAPAANEAVALRHMCLILEQGSKMDLVLQSLHKAAEELSEDCL